MQINAYSPSTNYASNITMAASLKAPENINDTEKKKKTVKKRIFIAALTLGAIIAAAGFFGPKGNNKKIAVSNQNINPVVDVVKPTEITVNTSCNCESLLDRNFRL